MKNSFTGFKGAGGLQIGAKPQQQGLFGVQPQQGLLFGSQPKQGMFGGQQQGMFGGQQQQGMFGGQQQQGVFGGPQQQGMFGGQQQGGGMLGGQQQGGGMFGSQQQGGGMFGGQQQGVQLGGQKQGGIFGQQLINQNQQNQSLKIDISKIPLLRQININDQQKFEIGQKALGTLFGFGNAKTITDGKKNTIKCAHLCTIHPYDQKSIYEACNTSTLLIILLFSYQTGQT
ncbi:MAG: hypothetical protein EZS28_043105 [Streblomastix strix]|uniref:Uncharacterized protein n=1 Tax=Streblomastix strix TaxID=222440 RepID=A0A5J4TSY0_9EUKA|nr:MAG: hypothetical protein EZS28_043105 [Streblomastix strix]